jgi:hypothetical protein
LPGVRYAALLAENFLDIADLLLDAALGLFHAAVHLQLWAPEDLAGFLLGPCP